ncbi:MAG: hypothetical protein BM555_02710 [Crocinitomix sp. MedPE-SWsnd]|nr:MAG: hypothetical protein BM555_02710 [Crocinitomix sp. MedPE-SWsnd]
MITEAENIILNKEYFELSADELATVSELVQNAEEYDEMKWFLASTQGMIAQEKIEATPELKNKVMAHLNQSESKRRFWLNGVIPFLLPEDKKFYQKPAFQMGMAALVVVGVFMFMPDKLDDPSLALHDRDSELKEFEDNTISSGEQQNFQDEKDEEAESISDVTTIDLDLEDKGISRIENPVVIDEVEEIVDPMADGYYEGKLSEDDLKKMENSKNQNLGGTTSFGSNSDDANFDMADDADLKQDLNTNKVDKPGNISANNDLNNVPATNANSTGTFKDGGDGNNQITTATLSKKEKDKRKSSKDRFDIQKKELNDEDVTMADYEVAPEDLQVMGGANVVADSIATDDYKYYSLNEKANESSEILPYKMHVDETKELKKLFTVFK